MLFGNITFLLGRLFETRLRREFFGTHSQSGKTTIKKHLRIVVPSLNSLGSVISYLLGQTL